MFVPDNPLHLIGAAIVLFGATAFFAALLHRWTLGFVYPLALLAALLALGSDIYALTSGASGSAILPLGLPQIGLRFRLDALSAFFGLVINLGVATACIYGLGLARSGETSPRVEPFIPIFAAAMNLVLLADDAFAFLFCWELMSVSSWILVLAHHEDAESRHAAHVYLLMANIGTIALLFAFGGMAGPAGGYAFDTIRAAELTPSTSALVFIAVLIGTGSKAGIVPLHAWLPLAHPAAPSHVSALMSGVMTKVAIYGLIRIVFDLLGNASLWSSALLLLLGAASALMGILYALMQSDLKKLLAYSTVENIGLIFVGLGLAVAFQANHLNELAALAFTAALLHVFNHSLFKTILFLGAGAVLHATGKRDLEQMGGLIHSMPGTALAFLIGAMAISALPPLNGFVSEWLTFQAILLSPSLPELQMKVLMPAIGAVLALTAALAAAAFVRAFGIAFLGRPRSEAARTAHETNRFALAALFLPALLCLLTGIFPGVAIDLLAPINTALIGQPMPAQAGIPWLSIVPVSASRSSYNGLLVFSFMVLSGGLVALIVRRIASHAVRRAPAWDCGFPDPSPATQYSASSLSQPIRRVFGSLTYCVDERVDMPAPGETSAARFHLGLGDRVWRLFYALPSRYVLRLTERMDRLQFLTIRRYLILMYSVLIILLVTITVVT